MCIYASIMRNDISIVSKNHHTIKSGSNMLGKIVDNILYALFLQHLKICKKIYPTLICCDNDRTHLCMTINSIVWSKQVSANTTQIVRYRNGRV